MTCQYLAGAIANIPGGVLVDTVGRKGLLMAVSLFWVGFPYLLMGFSHSYLMLLMCVMMVGIGNSLWHPTAIPTLARRYPDRKGLVLSLHGMGGNAGDAIAPLVDRRAARGVHLARGRDDQRRAGPRDVGLLLVFLGTLRLGPKKAAAAAGDDAGPVARRILPRPAPAAAQSQPGAAVHQRRVPLDDAERAAHFPAAVPGAGIGLFGRC